jgi:trehalose 6-phosphate synthase
MLRVARPDPRIGFFNHIPFPGYEIFAQLPWRRQIIEGLLGADLVGFQRGADVTNFLRACRRAARMTTKGSRVRVPQSHPAAAHPSRRTRMPPAPHAEGSLGPSRGVPDFNRQRRGGRSSPNGGGPSACLRDPRAIGDPKLVLLGVDRLDYTKGILHRLKACGELLRDGELTPSEAVRVLVASPSCERVDQYRALRDEVEVTVGGSMEIMVRLGVLRRLRFSLDRVWAFALGGAGAATPVSARRRCHSQPGGS